MSCSRKHILGKVALEFEPGIDWSWHLLGACALRSRHVGTTPRSQPHLCLEGRASEVVAGTEQAEVLAQRKRNLKTRSLEFPSWLSGNESD